MTDVNIAVAMMEDAHNDLYDAAFLITGDSDLAYKINTRNLPSEKSVCGVSTQPVKYQCEE